MVISIWSALSAITPLLAPLLSLFLIVLGRIIWNHEQRIRELERGSNRRSRTLYGDENDDRQIGLSEDIKNLDERIEDVERTLDRIENHLSDINGYTYNDDGSRDRND